jgi:cell division protein FtsB
MHVLENCNCLDTSCGSTPNKRSKIIETIWLFLLHHVIYDFWHLRYRAEDKDLLMKGCVR